MDNVLLCIGWPYLISNDLRAAVNDRVIIARQPGKIWALKNNKPIIVCGSGMLYLQKAKSAAGDLFLTSLKLKFSNSKEIK